VRIQTIEGEARIIRIETPDYKETNIAFGIGKLVSGRARFSELGLRPSKGVVEILEVPKGTLFDGKTTEGADVRIQFEVEQPRIVLVESPSYKSTNIAFGIGKYAGGRLRFSELGLVPKSGVLEWRVLIPSQVAGLVSPKQGMITVDDRVFATFAGRASLPPGWHDFQFQSQSLSILRASAANRSPRRPNKYRSNKCRSDSGKRRDSTVWRLRNIDAN